MTIEDLDRICDFLAESKFPREYVFFMDAKTSHQEFAFLKPSHHMEQPIKSATYKGRDVDLLLSYGGFLFVVIDPNKL